MKRDRHTVTGTNPVFTTCQSVHRGYGVYGRHLESVRALSIRGSSPRMLSGIGAKKPRLHKPAKVSKILNQLLPRSVKRPPSWVTFAM